MYKKFIKRFLDFILSLIALIILSPILLIIYILVRIKLGKPAIFKQERPGKNEKIFTLYKFRTMTDQKDSEGNLLPDEIRLTKFGAWLRATSLDELPEIFCILKGSMSMIGPRPQLVKDMVFMTNEQRMRHTAKPGLSGLSQISGRNSISWDRKLKCDLEYIEHVSFINDLKIIIKTIEKAFISQEGITEKGKATSTDYGDYLLHTNQISIEEYNKKQKEAKKLLKGLEL